MPVQYSLPGATNLALRSRGSMSLDIRAERGAGVSPSASPKTADDQMAAAMRASRLQEFLRGRREFLDLSQEEVAARLQLTARAYGTWERGRIKEWTDAKLFALAEALEMTGYQVTRLFQLAVEREPGPNLRDVPVQSVLRSPGIRAFLHDYEVLMNAVSLPTFLIDHHWNVIRSNQAYQELFQGLPAHPTAMPDINFLRFGLFHPDAPQVLVDHRGWRRLMLAKLASGLEEDAHDRTLLAIRQEVSEHPELNDDYLHGVPRVPGTDSCMAFRDGPVHTLRRPEHHEVAGCRLVEDRPKALQALECLRITIVFTNMGSDGSDGTRSHQ